MTKRTLINPLSFVSIPLNMKFSETDKLLASGTCFFYKKLEKLYMITNWHNVTGINPITKEKLGNHGGIPDTLEFTIPSINKKMSEWKQFSVNLYNENKKPEWLIHPIHKENVDVIALEIEFDSSVKDSILPINEIEFSDFDLKVADEVFILGFPYKIGNASQIPIWKRGSVASEPELDCDNLPKLFVDTASRPGMSGSPVIYKRIGIHGVKNGKINLETTIGEIKGFVGIYSGRILGKSELEAQLGIVWKKNVIDEIINGEEKDKFNVW